MIPIETANVSYYFVPVAEHGPSWAFLISKTIGIQVVGIDGNILPITALVLMFAAWGVWYWVLMIINSAKQIPVLYRRVTERNNESIEEEDND